MRLIRREMSRMERLAGQYAGIPPRADSETMREWISRMNHFPSSLKDSLMKLEELYESLRFRSGDASEEERALFLEECRMRRRTWKNLLRSSTAAEKKRNGARKKRVFFPLFILFSVIPRHPLPSFFHAGGMRKVYFPPDGSSSFRPPSAAAAGEEIEAVSIRGAGERITRA